MTAGDGDVRRRVGLSGRDIPRVWLVFFYCLCDWEVGGEVPNGTEDVCVSL